MKAFIQRVTSASVDISGETVGAIDKGFLILLGIAAGDGQSELELIMKKMLKLRIFPNEEGKLDKSLIDIQGDCLVISQFTLLASCKKGNRPSFTQAAEPLKAKALYEQCLSELRRNEFLGKVESGTFAADMQVSLVNDGPVSIMLDSADWQA